MSSSMALFSSPSSHLPTLTPSSSSSAKTLFTHKPYLSLRPKKTLFLLSTSATENGSGGVASAPVDIVVDSELKSEAGDVAVVPAVPVADSESESKSEVADVAAASNGSAATAAVEATVVKFENPKWVGGTWDVQQFRKDGKVDWDAVIDAEVKRRKWLQDTPESSNNDEPIVFDTSIIPWWAWVKRFHLPEAELLNGRAAMIGFFMAYLVDSLTGVGLVDQMGNFFCKSLLFVAVVGVLVIRKNEDIETVKKLVEETTFYDKQWQATWVDDQKKPNDSKKD